MKTFKFKSFQVQDYARAALHDGLILAHDTGCGKSIAAFTWPMLKVGWDKVPLGTETGQSMNPPSLFELKPKRAVLIVARGDLHAQFAAEAWNHFRIRLLPIDSQAAYERLTKPEHGVLQRRDAEGRPYVEPAFYITSYTQLASNGKETLTDPADHPNPRDLLAQWHLKTGPAQKCVTADQHGDWEEHQDEAGRLLPHVAADVCSFHAWRARVWPKPFQELGLRPTDSLATMDDAYAREGAKLARVQDATMRDALQQNLDDAKRVLENLLGRREHATFHDLTTRQQDWIIREYLCVKHEEFSAGVDEFHTSVKITRTGPGLTVRIPAGRLEARPAKEHWRGWEIVGTEEGKPEETEIALVKNEAEARLWFSQHAKEHHAATRKTRCLYSPCLADLCYDAFACVCVDEAVAMKGEDTHIGKGVRLMAPDYRLCLTATPIKNRLPDVFRLAWWATGGRDDAHARWPYADDSAERERFASTFLVCERNLTMEKTKSKRYKKYTPEVCNVHGLWKLFGPVVLRRRKQDTGEDIVPRFRKVIRVEPGTVQQQVYQYHLQASYTDKHGKRAVGAQLQALRIAAADPTSELLIAKPGHTRIKCPDCKGTGGGRSPRGKEGDRLATSSATCPACDGRGDLALPHRSGSPFIPKHAAVLEVVAEVLERKEQVVIFSAFNDPLDLLSRWFKEADIRHEVLDGRTAQKKRGAKAAKFKEGRADADSVPVLLAGVECMAEGHSFHRANNVVLFAYSWAYDKFKQALDRVHRLNSEKPVNVYVILCDGTIDRRLESLVQDKQDAVELVLDGRLIGEATEEVNLAQLLQDAARDFDPNSKTVDEGLLARRWHDLRARLQGAFFNWLPVAQASSLRVTGASVLPAAVANTGQGCPVNPPAGMPALPRRAVLNLDRDRQPDRATPQTPMENKPRFDTSKLGSQKSEVRSQKPENQPPASAHKATVFNPAGDWRATMRRNAAILAALVGPDV